MNKKNIKGIRPEAMEKLEKYIWRGNIRELENVIERAVLLETTDNIQIESLPDEIKNYISEPLKTISDIPSDSLNLEDFLSKLEKDIITNALKKTRGVKTKAAELLKMSFRSFRYKLEKYNIENDKG